MLLDIIKNKYELEEKDIGDLSNYSVNGMEFNIKAYNALNLGNVSYNQANGMNGAMSLISLVINPFEIDCPLISIDYVQAFGTNKVYIEIYNTLLNEKFDVDKMFNFSSKYSNLIDEESSKQWYDNLILYSLRKSTNDQNLAKEMLYEALITYLETIKNAKICDQKLKVQKAKVYSDGLIEHGGPATDSVKLVLGEEKLKELFNKVTFGVE